MESRESPDIRDYVAVILKRRWVIITVFVVLVATVAIGSFRMVPVFEATAQLLIERESPRIVNIEEVLAVNASNLDYYQTQYEMLKSKSLAVLVIETLNLADSIEFKPKSEEFAFNLKAIVTSWVKTGVESISSQKTREARISQDREVNYLIEAYLQKLRVGPVRNSRLVNISFEGHDPELITRIVHTHAKLYIEQNLERKLNASREALTWINSRIRETKIKLEESEQALQRYREKNNLVSIDFEERHNIIIQELNNLNTALTTAKTKRMGMENLYNELRKLSKDPLMIESLPAVVNNYLIQQLKTEYVKLQGRYSDLSQKFGPDHPKMIRMKSEISEMKNKIAQEVTNIARSIKVEYEVSRAKEESIARALEDQKRIASGLNEKEIHYNVLKRDVETNRILYESLLTRAKETGITEELKASNIMVVDAPRIPDRPVKPRKTLNILLAIITGLTLGVGLAFFFEYLDNTIKTPDEVERYLNLPTLGLIPHYKSK
ncbi:MAG: GumC family protein [Pseudomonadota bacterium]